MFRNMCFFFNSKAVGRKVVVVRGSTTVRTECSRSDPTPTCDFTDVFDVPIPKCVHYCRAADELCGALATPLYSSMVISPSSSDTNLVSNQPMPSFPERMHGCLCCNEQQWIWGSNIGFFFAMQTVPFKCYWSIGWCFENAALPSWWTIAHW